MRFGTPHSVRKLPSPPPQIAFTEDNLYHSLDLTSVYCEELAGIGAEPTQHQTRCGRKRHLGTSANFKLHLYRHAFKPSTFTMIPWMKLGELESASLTPPPAPLPSTNPPNENARLRFAVSGNAVGKLPRPSPVTIPSLTCQQSPVVREPWL